MSGALAATLAIATTTVGVAGLSGSSAMLAEAIHSTVDCGNSLLLLVGNRLSERPASDLHPFGHGKELYFWGLIVAVLVFGIGGGVSFYEGVLHVRQPLPLRDAHWNYVVLGAAAVFEGTSFAIALREFRREAAGRPLWLALRSSKDPTTYTVLAEDAAALAGLALAAAGIFASHRWGRPALDGVASMAIGLLLAGVAVLLIREARGLLIGEGIRASTAREIGVLVAQHPEVERVGRPLSMYIGREQVLLTLEVQFRDGTPVEAVAQAIDAMEREVRRRFPVIGHISIEPRRLGPERPS